MVRSYLGGFRVKLATIDGKSCAYIIERNIFIDLFAIFNVVLFESYPQKVSPDFENLISIYHFDLFIIIVGY